MKSTFISVSVLLCLMMIFYSDKTSTKVGNNSGGEKRHKQIVINCKQAPLIDYSNLVLLEGPDKNTALTRVINYLTYSKCHNRFPSEHILKAYYFTPKMLEASYTVIEHSEGFNKQPGFMKISGESGMEILFCFNKMVINCSNAVCECPYDFNHIPRELSPNDE